MDTSVSYSVQSFMTCSISVFGAMLVVTAVTPTIIVAIALLSIVYYRVQVSTPCLSCTLLKRDAAVSVRRSAAGGEGGGGARGGGGEGGECPEGHRHRVVLGGAWGKGGVSCVLCFSNNKQMCPDKPLCCCVYFLNNNSASWLPFLLGDIQWTHGKGLSSALTCFLVTPGPGILD